MRLAAAILGAALILTGCGPEVHFGQPFFHLAVIR
jgi:hypothetical protein